MLKHYDFCLLGQKDQALDIKHSVIKTRPRSRNAGGSESRALNPTPLGTFGMELECRPPPPRLTSVPDLNKALCA